MEHFCSKTSSFGSSKMWSLFLVFFALKDSFSTTLNIETGKEEACAQEIVVSAILENHQDHSLAYLFSGHNVWSLNIEDGELKQVQKTSDVFPNVTEVIRAAGDDKFANAYYLYGTDHGFYVNSSETIVQTIEEMNRNLGKDIEADLGSRIICSANYLTDEENAILNLVIEDGHIYRCHIKKNHEKGSCKEEQDSNLCNIKVSELKECQGLLIDDVIEGQHNAEYRLLFANKDALFYCRANQLVYNKSFNTLFDCIITLITIVITACVVAVIALVVAVVVIIGYVIRRQSKSVKFFTLKDSFSAKTIKYTERSQRSKQFPGSDSITAKNSNF